MYFAFVGLTIAFPFRDFLEKDSQVTFTLNRSTKMERLNQKALKLELDALMKGVDDHQEALSVYADKVIGILIPRHLGGHGNNTSLNALYNALVEKRLDTWAASLKWYIKDNYSDIIEYRDDTFRLTKGNKEVRELPKPNGGTVLSYVRVMTEEQKQERALAAQKSKETRETNKRIAEDNAKGVITLKQENDELRIRYQELKNAPKGKKEKELSERVEKQQTIIQEKDSSLSVARTELSELKESNAKLNQRVTLLENALNEKAQEIQRLQGMLQSNGIIFELNSKIKELENSLAA